MRRCWAIVPALATAGLFLFWGLPRVSDDRASQPESGRPDGNLQSSIQKTASPLAGVPGEPCDIPLTSTGDPPEIRDSGYHVKGKIMSLDGTPLSSASIMFYRDPPDPLHSNSTTLPTATQKSDAAGSYLLSFDEPVRGFLRVSAPGHAEVSDSLDLPGPETIAKNFRLRPAPACVEGFVLGLNHTPVEGALVSIWLDTGQVRTLLDSASLSPIAAVTKPSGKYEIRGIPEGVAAINVKARGFLADSSLYYPEAGSCKWVDFQLSRALVVTLKIKDESGLAISGAEARAQGIIAKADSAGLVEFDLLPDTDSFRCEISAAGYRSRAVTLIPAALPEAVSLEAVETDPDRQLSGRVISQFGAGIPGARITLSDGFGKLGGIISTGKDGSFTLTVPESSVRPFRKFIVRKVGYIEERLRLPMEREPENIILVTLRRPETGIAGVVLDGAGNPIPRFKVILSSLWSDELPLARFQAIGADWSPPVTYLRDVEEESGSFLITDIPAGKYNISIESLPYASTLRSARLSLGIIELRKGFIYSGVRADLPPPAAVK